MNTNTPSRPGAVPDAVGVGRTAHCLHEWAHGYCGICGASDPYYPAPVAPCEREDVPEANFGNPDAAAACDCHKHEQQVCDICQREAGAGTVDVCRECGRVQSALIEPATVRWVVCASCEAGGSMLSPSAAPRASYEPGAMDRVIGRAYQAWCEEQAAAPRADATREAGAVPEALVELAAVAICHAFNGGVTDEYSRAWSDCSEESRDEYRVEARAVLRELAAPVAPCERCGVRDAEIMQVMEERDHYHEMADKLADAIVSLTVGGDVVEAIGEHSNLNDPWQNALDLADNHAQPHPDLSARDAARVYALRRALDSARANLLVDDPPIGFVIDILDAALRASDGVGGEGVSNG